MASPADPSTSARRQRQFGDVLRDRRKASGYSLRKFAELVGISPTYLSQVEQCNVMPPTADRVKRMADLLCENADEWTVLAGPVREDLFETFRAAPREVANLLREVRGMTADQIRSLCEAASELKTTIH